MDPSESRRHFTCTLLALPCKSLIINGAGEGNRTLVSGLGSPHSASEPRPLTASGLVAPREPRAQLQSWAVCGMNSQMTNDEVRRLRHSSFVIPHFAYGAACKRTKPARFTPRK